MTSSVVRGVILVACAVAAGAQPVVGSRPVSNLDNPWEIKPVLEQIASHAAQLETALNHLDAQAWVEKGASDTYTAQLESSKLQARAVGTEAYGLTVNPEKLSSALQVLFRIQGLETMVSSLEEAVRRYQSPGDAQNLVRLIAEGGANRNRLQQYVVNLAAEREKDLTVMDQEAQRCRALVTQPPATAPRTRKK
jgi:hypothetical protein